jgi:hypothetical protein
MLTEPVVPREIAGLHTILGFGQASLAKMFETNSWALSMRELPRLSSPSHDSLQDACYPLGRQTQYFSAQVIDHNKRAETRPQDKLSHIESIDR